MSVYGEDFDKLPVWFNIVTGDFDISFCQNLKTLDGCPKEVGDFLCNSLKSRKFTEADVEKWCKVGGSTNAMHESQHNITT